MFEHIPFFVPDTELHRCFAEHVPDRLAYRFRPVDHEQHSLFSFKQKTAYELTASDWSSDVCSSDLGWQKWEYRRMRCSVSDADAGEYIEDRKSGVEGKSVRCCVDRGGRRIIKKKKKIKERRESVEGRRGRERGGNERL